MANPRDTILQQDVKSFHSAFFNDIKGIDISQLKSGFIALKFDDEKKASKFSQLRNNQSYLKFYLIKIDLYVFIKISFINKKIEKTRENKILLDTDDVEKEKREQTPKDLKTIEKLICSKLEENKDLEFVLIKQADFWKEFDQIKRDTLANRYNYNTAQDNFIAFKNHYSSFEKEYQNSLPEKVGEKRKEAPIDTDHTYPFTNRLIRKEKEPSLKRNSLTLTSENTFNQFSSTSNILQIIGSDKSNESNEHNESNKSDENKLDTLNQTNISDIAKRCFITPKSMQTVEELFRAEPFSKPITLEDTALFVSKKNRHETLKETINNNLLVMRKIGYYLAAQHYSALPGNGIDLLVVLNEKNNNIEQHIQAFTQFLHKEQQRLPSDSGEKEQFEESYLRTEEDWKNLLLNRDDKNPLLAKKITRRKEQAEKREMRERTASPYEINQLALYALMQGMREKWKEHKTSVIPASKSMSDDPTIKSSFGQNTKQTSSLKKGYYQGTDYTEQDKSIRFNTDSLNTKKQFNEEIHNRRFHQMARRFGLFDLTEDAIMTEKNNTEKNTESFDNSTKSYPSKALEHMPDLYNMSLLKEWF